MTAAGQDRRQGAREVRRRFGAARREARRSLLDRWPELERSDGPGYAAARTQAVAELGHRVADDRLAGLLDAEKALIQAGEQVFQEELAEARVLRFVRLTKSVVLAQRLRESGDPANRAHFERIAAAEAGPLLPPAPRTARRP
jgi:hypothetical protein